MRALIHWPWWNVSVSVRQSVSCAQRVGPRRKITPTEAWLARNTNSRGGVRWMDMLRGPGGSGIHVTLTIPGSLRRAAVPVALLRFRESDSDHARRSGQDSPGDCTGLQVRQQKAVN